MQSDPISTRRSCLNQTQPCEVLVILNEASTAFDGIERRYPQVRFIKTSLRPLGGTRNFGLQFVKTPWVSFLDGDDIWYERKLERQLAVATLKGADLVGTDHVLLSEAGIRCAFSLSANIPMPSSWLARTELFRRRPFHPSAPSEDGLWWVENYATCRLRRLPEFHLGYRVRDGSLSNASPSKRRKALAVLVARHQLVRPLALAFTWALNRVSARTSYRWNERAWGPRPECVQ